MSNTLISLARSRVAVALFALLLLCGGAVALASCGTNAGLRGAIASIDTAGSSFVLTPRPAAGGPSGVTVTITPQTEFRGALRGFSDLTVGMQVSVQGAAQGGTNTLTATEIEDQREDAAGDKNGAQDGDQFKGTVDSTDAVHAAFGLKLADGTIKTVTTSSQTEFEGTLHRFADLTQGLRVSVKGALRADGSIAAASVEAENENDQDNAEDVEVTGTIDSISAAGSSFVLKLADGTTKTVVTNARTEFDGGFHGFADLKAGMAVEVRGTSQSGGSLLATRVHREDGGGSGDGSGGHDGSGSGGSGGGGDDGSGHH